MAGEKLFENMELKDILNVVEWKPTKNAYDVAYATIKIRPQTLSSGELMIFGTGEMHLRDIYICKNNCICGLCDTPRFIRDLEEELNHNLSFIIMGRMRMTRLTTSELNKMYKFWEAMMFAALYIGDYNKALDYIYEAYLFREEAMLAYGFIDMGHMNWMVGLVDLIGAITRGWLYHFLATKTTVAKAINKFNKEVNTRSDKCPWNCAQKLIR
jgi:hypothetical protein